MLLTIIATDWERLFNTYGWPTVILLIVLVVLYKGVWPRVVKYLDQQERIAEEARLAIIKRAEKLEEREDKQLTNFTEALDGLKEVLQTSLLRQDSQIAILEETLKVSKETNTIVKGKYK